MTEFDRFIVTIKLGNAAMETHDDVAGVLQTVAHELELEEECGNIRDLNGNTVGEWRFTTPAV